MQGGDNAFDGVVEQHGTDADAEIEFEAVGIGEERLVLPDRIVLVVENRPTGSHPPRRYRRVPCAGPARRTRPARRLPRSCRWRAQGSVPSAARFRRWHSEIWCADGGWVFRPARMSPERTGVALLPLLEVTPSAVRMFFSVPLCQSHLSMRLRSRISRRRSPSHQIAKFADRGAGPMFSPWQVRRPDEPPHISSPRWRGSMSAESPRPMSIPGP